MAHNASVANPAALPIMVMAWAWNMAPVARPPRANTAVEKVGGHGASLTIRRVPDSHRRLSITMGTASAAASAQVAAAAMCHASLTPGGQ